MESMKAIEIPVAIDCSRCVVDFRVQQSDPILLYITHIHAIPRWTTEINNTERKQRQTAENPSQRLASTEKSLENIDILRRSSRADID